MCGLLAILSLRGPVDGAAARGALSLLAHRGPDGAGETVRWDGRLWLGHRRLAILDTGESAAQPMVDPLTGSALLFNGAVYNYVELRRDLEAEGCAFTPGAGDTEVVLAALRTWGTDAFARFNGMWAIVFHDVPGDRIVVSRDRLGVKPLYWLSDGRRIVMASEIRPIVAATGLAVRPDPIAVHDFLVAGLSEHAGRTFVDGVVEVPAGAAWTVARDGRVRPGRFHDWDSTVAPADAASPEGLRDLLADATRLRLRADVPTAVLLSGGLDSGIVAREATRATGETRSRLDGFVTYGYEDGDREPHDETARAAETARRVGPDVPLTVLRVDPVPTMADLDAVLTAQEQPFATPSIVASLRLYRHLRERGVKVALTGEGSDETFAGYTRLFGALDGRDALRRGDVGRFAASLRSPHAGAGPVANRLAWDLPTPLLRALLRRERPNVGAMAPAFWADTADLFETLRDRARDPLATVMGGGAIARLLPHVLRMADRNGMRAGVEIRSPFLDWRVVAAALALPTGARFDPREGGKLPLRRAYAGLLPDAVVAGRKTHGLGMAEQFAVARLPLGPLLDDPPPEAAAFLDVPALRRALAQGAPGMSVWWPVCLLMWLDRLRGGRPAGPGPAC